MPVHYSATFYLSALPPHAAKLWRMLGCPEVGKRGNKVDFVFGLEVINKNGP